MNPQEYEHFVSYSGRVAHAAVQRVMNKKKWPLVPDEDRVSIIRSIYEAARKQYRDEIREHRARSN
jgi:hypothetical protein